MKKLSNPSLYSPTSFLLVRSIMANLNSEDKNLMIFDDLLLERQNKCECYYIRGWHSNVDCFYFSQNYFKLPRQTIRENVNFICLFPQDLKNINHIYNDHVGDDMTKEDFRRFSKKCWEKPHVNGTTKNTIYSFFPKVSPGYKIIETPRNLVYLPIILDTIDSLNVSITDQDDHLLNLRNEKLTIRFHIREAR